MDSRFSDWIRRGEKLFDQSHAYCDQLDRVIAQLQAERDACRHDLKTMAKVLGQTPPVQAPRKMPAGLSALVRSM